LAYRNKAKKVWEERALQLLKKVIAKDADKERRFIQKEIYNYSDYIINQSNKLENENEDREARLLKDTLVEIKNKANQIRLLGDELTEPFLLFVIGMGNYGKSTLVNSLIGERLAEMDVLPKTWKIDIYEKSFKKQDITIIYKNGEQKNVSKREAELIIAKEEEKRIKSEDQIESKYQELSKNLKLIEAKEELKEKLNKNLLYKSPIVEMHWPCNPKNNSLLNKFNIVDTPGLWQETNGKKTKEDLRAYYHKADGVLWMLDANTIASAKANKLVKDLEKSIEMVGGEVNNVLAVLNRIDLVRKENEENVKKVMKKVEQIYNDKFIDIIPISAKEALSGIINNDHKLYKGSGFPNLLNSIEVNFAKRAARIKTQSKLNGLKGYLRDIKVDIRDYKEKIDSDCEKNKEMKKTLNKETNKLKYKIKNMINESHLNNYEKKVLTNIETKAEVLFDFKDEEQDYIERYIKNNIFEKKYLEDRMSKFQGYYEKKLESAFNDLIKMSQISEFQYLNKVTSLKIQKINHNYNNNININSSEISDKSSFGNLMTMAAGGIFLGPVGIILGLLANSFGLVRWIVKQFKLPELKDKLKSELRKILKMVRNKVINQLNRDLKNIRKNINKYREKSFSKLHGDIKEINSVYNFIDNIEKMQSDNIKYKSDIFNIIKE